MSKTQLFMAVALACWSTTLSAIANCDTTGTATNGTTICVKCKDGYYVNATNSLTTCFACTTGCEECGILNNSYVCQDCQDGFRLESSNSTCIACSAGCEKCNNTKCIECNDGMTIQSDGTCKQASRSWGTIIIWILVIAAIGAGGYFAYNKYFANQREGVGAIDYERIFTVIKISICLGVYCVVAARLGSR